MLHKKLINIKVSILLISSVVDESPGIYYDNLDEFKGSILVIHLSL